MPAEFQLVLRIENISEVVLNMKFYASLFAILLVFSVVLFVQGAMDPESDPCCRVPPPYPCFAPCMKTTTPQPSVSK